MSPRELNDIPHDCCFPALGAKAAREALEHNNCVASSGIPLHPVSYVEPTGMFHSVEPKVVA